MRVLTLSSHLLWTLALQDLHVRPLPQRVESQAAQGTGVTKEEDLKACSVRVVAVPPIALYERDYGSLKDRRTWEVRRDELDLRSEGRLFHLCQHRRPCRIKQVLHRSSVSVIPCDERRGETHLEDRASISETAIRLVRISQVPQSCNLPPLALDSR